MRLYRVILVLALAPRALRTSWRLLVAFGILLWVELPATCSALVRSSPTPARDAGTREQSIEEKTTQVDRSADNTRSSEDVDIYWDSASSGNAQPGAEPVCFSSDVKALCCPSACATKNSSKWERADRVLRECMRGIGCSDAESRGATVGMRCRCGKVKP